MTVLKTFLKLPKSPALIRAFSSEKQIQEVSIPVPWGEVRGKWWGPKDQRPILCLHGWQDNCGTFDRLIPLLQKNIGFLAIDFPGHGYSSRLPLGIYYHFTTYLLTIQYIRKFFQWPKVSLMGHSLGGLSSYTYTMLYPQNIDFVICLDGAKPLIIKNRIGSMAKYIDKFLQNNERVSSDKEPPSYSVEEIKLKVHAPNKGSVNLEYTPYILERNIAPSKEHPGKYYFTRDPRLKSGELLNFSQEELVEHAQNITCPIFMSKHKQGSYYEIKQNFYDVLDVLKRNSRDCDFHYINGTHHGHLNDPAELAGLISNFIRKHNIEDRSIGGITPDIIVNEDLKMNKIFVTES
ncbi:probable serine hydrolase isoform X1 [Euwallacea fornicatus]|uniref:probable serine hydrolase isoform X1 n=1 Tax=Euwallacea fornicatus TaxID=995702 RepID=UPI00338E4DDA